MKIVLDTNIWISGLLLPTSYAALVLEHWRLSKFNVVTSKAILDEIKRVLLYPKIQRRIHWDTMRVEQYVTTLQFLTEYISLETSTEYPHVPRDENDTPILRTFLISQADYLITGDDDLLSLKHDYPTIITLTEFQRLS